MLLSIGSKQTRQSRGCLYLSEVQIKIDINLLCRSKTANINKCTKVEDFKLQSRKYDLQARFVVSTDELSTKNHIHSLQNT